MELLNPNIQNGSFNARGACPHCSVVSLHILVPSPFLRPLPGGMPQSNCLLQCQNCQGVIFAVASRNPQMAILDFKENYPVENPEESVDKNIPTGVRDDYVEALRCRSVTAHKACVVMCRRSLQSSCRNFKASGKQLIDQIDDLAGNGRITAALKDMAHDIRKLGNAGAHPDEDGLGDVTKEDSDDIVEFTRQYFEHVYVMPAKSEAFRKRREAPRTGSA